MLPYLLETCKWGAITSKMQEMSGSRGETWLCGQNTSQRWLNVDKYPKLGTRNPFHMEQLTLNTWNLMQRVLTKVQMGIMFQHPPLSQNGSEQQNRTQATKDYGHPLHY